MISFGPTLQGVHSPDERMLIPTVQKFWDHLLDILKNIPTKYLMEQTDDTLFTKTQEEYETAFRILFFLCLCFFRLQSVMH